MKSSVSTQCEIAQVLYPSLCVIYPTSTYHPRYFLTSLLVFSVSPNKDVSSSQAAESGTARHAVGAQ